MVYCGQLWSMIQQWLVVVNNGQKGGQEWSIMINDYGFMLVFVTVH